MGGAEVFTYENAKRWVKAGHEVTLLLLKQRFWKFTVILKYEANGL